MGKVPPTAAVATTEMKTKKKKGRPSKNPLHLSPVLNSTSRRSTRRNPNQLNSPPQPEFDDDDDDERKEKKVKLVVRLPQSDEKTKLSEKRQQQSGPHSRDYDSGSGSDSEPESEDRGESAKKRKIDGVDRGSDDGGLDQDDKVDVRATDTPLDGTGSPLESGPTTPLPDKKLLVFILDRLQKKDTYGVFSEPVDPNELPDYFEIVEQPMDFGTVRKKLDNEAYKNLEELEADVLLICSNAMQYNSSDTVYYRQARSIQEVANRDFKNLKHEGDDGEPQPKVVRRGRPPNSKNQKKSPEPSQLDRVGTELSSGANLATGEDKQTGSNSYNLRKGPALFRVRPTDHPFVSSYASRNGENYSDFLVDWNNEFPASILRADMKHGKKNFTVDENRRDTYKQFHPLSADNNSPVFVNAIGNMKRLMPLGLQEAFAYARSLSRYAANLGPVAWKMASMKIEAVLPAGVQYGPGWVGDDEAPSKASSFSVENEKSGNNTTAVEAIEGSRKTPFPSLHKIPTNHHSERNGLNGTFGYRTAQVKASNSHGDAETRDSLDLSQRRNPSVPPDLNVRVTAGSPSSSSLQIGSPQHPDLALQL